jgi:hypothetical protein
MANQSKTYPLADPAALAANIAALGGLKIDPTQPTGSASESTALGTVTLSWAIAESVITVTIAKKPWDLPAGTVWEHVDALFR